MASWSLILFILPVTNRSAVRSAFCRLERMWGSLQVSSCVRTKRSFLTGLCQVYSASSPWLARLPRLDGATSDGLLRTSDVPSDTSPVTCDRLQNHSLREVLGRVQRTERKLKHITSINLACGLALSAYCITVQKLCL